MKYFGKITSGKDLVTKEFVEGNCCGQVESLPAAAAEYEGKIYQYTGETTTAEPIYTHGAFYECKESSTAGTYEWSAVATITGSYLPLAGGTLTGAITRQDGEVLAKAYDDDGQIWVHGGTGKTDGSTLVLSGKDDPSLGGGFFIDTVYNDTNKALEGMAGQLTWGDGKVAIQVEAMPTASADEKGNVYHFIGATDTDYTHGRFYECVQDGSSYEWQELSQGPDAIIEVTALPTSEIETKAIYKLMGNSTYTFIGCYKLSDARVAEGYTIDSAGIYFNGTFLLGWNDLASRWESLSEVFVANSYGKVHLYQSKSDSSYKILYDAYLDTDAYQLCLYDTTLAAWKVIYDTSHNLSSYLPLAGGTLTGDLTFSNGKKIGDYLPLTGGTLTGALTFSNGKTIENYLPLTGGTMSGAIKTTVYDGIQSGDATSRLVMNGGNGSGARLYLLGSKSTYWPAGITGAGGFELHAISDEDSYALYGGASGVLKWGDYQLVVKHNIELEFTLNSGFTIVEAAHSKLYYNELGLTLNLCFHATMAINTWVTVCSFGLPDDGGYQPAYQASGPWCSENVSTVGAWKLCPQSSGSNTWELRICTAVAANPKYVRINGYVPWSV